MYRKYIFFKLSTKTKYSAYTTYSHNSYFWRILPVVTNINVASY
jgi:hypothetical protein